MHDVDVCVHFTFNTVYLLTIVAVIQVVVYVYLYFELVCVLNAVEY